MMLVLLNPETYETLASPLQSLKRAYKISVFVAIAAMFRFLGP